MCRSGRKTPVARACDPEPRDRRAVPARLEWPAPTHRPGAGSLRCCSVVMPRRPDMNIVPTLDTETAQKLDDELWFKDVIIYQLHVKAFQDSNGDGVGDFVGLTERLDYLHDLGVTALWLLPFYPSPGRDDGYDISDYGDINPLFGTMRNFRRFMAGRQAPRPAGDHRAGRQSHIGPAPLVQARQAQLERFERAQLVRLGRHRSEIRWHAHHFQRQRKIELDLEPGGASLLLASLLLASAGLELR